MEDEAKTIDALNSLIEVNNKRMKFYKFLEGKTQHKELRSLFSHYAAQSKEFSNTLSTWRSAYGGFPHTDEKGDRIWRHVVSLLGHWLRKNVASKCEEIEHDVLKEYKRVKQMSFIPSPTAVEIEHQSRAIEDALTKLRTLREQGGSNVSVREALAHTIAF